MEAAAGGGWIMSRRLKFMVFVRGLTRGLRNLPRRTLSGGTAAMAALAVRCPRTRAILPVVTMILATLTISSCTSSCTMVTDPSSSRPPVFSPGVPTVRVKLGQPMHVVQISTTSGYRLLADGREVNASSYGLSATTITYSNGRWTVSGGGLPSVINAGSLFIQLTGNGVVGLAPCNWSGSPTTALVYYRGDMRLLPQDASSFIAINQVDMEGYIAGVIPKELYPSWHYETYRALAIAARTFAFYHKNHPKVEGQPFDLGDNESSQMYGGYTAERSVPYAYKAVESTRGRVLVYGGQVFMAQYSSCCGGRVNPAYVLRSDAPDEGPLRGGQACTDCTASNKFNWPPVTIRKWELLYALQVRYERARNLSSIYDIQVVSQTPYGRPVMVDVVGAGESVRLRADDLRLAWNMYNTKNGGNPAKSLNSMNCQWRANSDSITFYNGHGYGHGVGLCQFGAEGKASRGQSAEQILGAYYPGASVKRAW